MKRNGPPPKPTVLRVLHGDRPNRINRDEPTAPDLDDLAPPGTLTPPARIVWAELAPVLSRMRVLSVADVVALSVLCENVVLLREAAATVNESSVLVRDGDGRLIKNPAISPMINTAALVHRYLCEFGMTPSSRSTIRRPKPSTDERLSLLS